MKQRIYWPMIFIVVLAAFLRFYGLESNPVSPNWDEASHGVNAYSILTTGKDEWGRSLPLIFRAFGDYKLPVYIYLSILPVWLFGLNVLAIRFVSALAGTFAIVGIYLLVKEFFKKHSQSQPSVYYFPLFAAFLLATSPWHFFISRPALEANLSLTLIIFGFYYLLKFFHKESSLLPAVIFLGLSLHTYNTARVFVPLLVLIAFAIYRPAIELFSSKPYTTLASITLTLLFSVLIIFQVYEGEGVARYEKLKILTPAIVYQIGESRTNSSLPPLVSKLIYNRPVHFTLTALKNYISYFTPNFFSQHSGAQSQFAIPGQHLLTLPVFILVLVGLVSSLSLLTTLPHIRFLLSWLLISPLASALTIDPPQALRPNPMIPALIIFACLGYSFLLKLGGEKWRIIFSLLLILWLTLSCLIYLKEYFGNYKMQYSQSWQYGYKEVMDFVNNHKSEYNRVFITKRYGEPHIFYAFYTLLNPNILQPGIENIRFQKSDWFWTDKIGKVYFVNDWQIPTTSTSSLTLESGERVATDKSLLVTSPDHLPINAHIIKKINFLDNSPAFIIALIP